MPGLIHSTKPEPKPWAVGLILVAVAVLAGGSVPGDGLLAFCRLGVAGLRGHDPTRTAAAMVRRDRAQRGGWSCLIHATQPEPKPWT